MLTSLALALFLGQANMGLTVPTPGVTPGPTYATQISNDLVIIDAHNHTPGNGVLVPTAGLNINANLPFNGFGATGFNSCTGTACGLQIPYHGTLVADAGAFDAIELDGTSGITQGVASTGLTLTGAAAATGGIGLTLNNSVTQTTGKLVSFQNNGSEKLSVQFNGELLATSIPDATIFGSWTDAHGNLLLSLASTPAGAGPLVLGSNYTLQLNSTTLTFSGSFFGTANAASATTIKGNAAATAGIANVLDNQTTQTSGSIVAFETGGVSKATVNSAGSFLSNPGLFTTGVTTTTVTLKGTAAAAGTATAMDGTVDVTGTGYITQFNAAGTPEMAITGRGHLIPLSTAPANPAAGAFAAGYQSAGAVNTISITGSDLAFELTFTTGTACSTINAGTLLVTITLNQAYSSTSYVPMAAYNTAPTVIAAGYGASDEAPLIVNQNTAGVVKIYAATTFLPVLSTTYRIGVTTIGAGATN